MRWYEKSLPTVHDVASSVSEAVQSLSALKGIEETRAFGSYAENRHNPEFSIKDVDLLVRCNFESGDLFAIDSTPYSALSLPRDELEEEGFNPDCVSFTRKCIALKKNGFDIWAISKDNLLMHWGATPETVEEWKELRKRAESKANRITGIKKNDLCRSSESQIKSWRSIYDEVIHSFAGNDPVGWYASSVDPSEILHKSVVL